MKVIGILVIFLFIASIDIPKLLKLKDKKYFWIYFTILALGFVVSILQVFLENPMGPLLLLNKMIEEYK